LLFRDIKNLDRNLAKLVEFTLENKRIQKKIPSISFEKMTKFSGKE
jgi:hypothetical protein